MADAAAAPASTIVQPPGQTINSFKKCQYLGHITDRLTKNTSPDAGQKMREIHLVANKAMHAVHKDHKHRHLGFSSCYVTSEGIYLYEAEEKINVQPKMSWSRAAREIYCVVMGARSALFKNQLACIMRFIPGADGKVALDKDGSIEVDCCVIEFHHDRKNRAAKFHKACEQMMKALLFAEMSKLEIAEVDDAAAAETKGGEDQIVGGYMDIPVAGAKKDDDGVNSGYMDVPEPHEIGKPARRRISQSVADGADYLQVVVGSMPGDSATSLKAALDKLDDDDESDPADSDDEE